MADRASPHARAAAGTTVIHVALPQPAYLATDEAARHAGGAGMSG